MFGVNTPFPISQRDRGITIRRFAGKHAVGSGLIYFNAVIGPDLNHEFEAVVVGVGRVLQACMPEAAVLQRKRHLLHVIVEQLVGFMRRGLYRRKKLQDGGRQDGGAQ